MKNDVLNFIKYVIKRWFVLAIAIVLGCMVGVVKYLNTNNLDECEMKVYIYQNFPDDSKNINVSTDGLLKNSINLMNSLDYLKPICENNDINLKSSMLKNIFSFEQTSTNIVKITMRLEDEIKMKNIGNEICSTLQTYLNKNTFANIDEDGNFKVGTPETQKIFVTVSMAPTLIDAEDKTFDVMGTILYVMIFVVLAGIILLCSFIVFGKIHNIEQLNQKYNFNISMGDDFVDGAIKSITNQLTKTNENNKSFVFLTNNLDDKQKLEICKNMANNKRILMVDIDKLSSYNPNKQSEFQIENLTNNIDKFKFNNINEFILFDYLVKLFSENGYDFACIYINNKYNNAFTIPGAKLGDKIFVDIDTSIDTLDKLDQLFLQLERGGVKVDGGVVVKRV